MLRMVASHKSATKAWCNLYKYIYPLRGGYGNNKDLISA